MIPHALFVPASLPEKYGGAYEVSHMGVVLRIRDGKAQHVGGIWVEHVPAKKADGSPDYLKPYTTIEHQNPVSGRIVADAEKGGWWLVPEKYIEEFAAAWAAAHPEDKE